MSLDAPARESENAVPILWRLPEGVSYRSLDYWTRLGYLHPEGDPRPGSGRNREWADSELEAAAMIARLRAVGIELGLAARAARDLLAAPDRPARLPGGLLITAEAQEAAS